MQPWIDALRTVDQRGDKALLVELLKFNKSIPREARWHLADLLERYTLKRRRGEQRTPSYDYSETTRRLKWAKESVRGKRGQERERAIEDAARVYEVPLASLRRFLAGKHSSSRRQKKRRPPR